MLPKPECYVTTFALAESESMPGVSEAWTESRQLFETLVNNLRLQARLGIFFYFLARKPLKSPDSEKLMKTNERNFAFIYFHLLAFAFAAHSRLGCIRRRASGPWSAARGEHWAPPLSHVNS